MATLTRLALALTSTRSQACTLYACLAPYPLLVKLFFSTLSFLVLRTCSTQGCIRRRPWDSGGSTSMMRVPPLPFPHTISDAAKMATTTNTYQQLVDDGRAFIPA